MAEEEPVKEAPKITLTKEQMEEMRRDVADAKATLVSKDTQDAIAKAKEEGADEARKEEELKQKADEATKLAEETKKRLEEQEKASSEKLEAMEKKLNDMVESKQILAAEDPFKTTPALTDKVDKMSEEEVTALEERSARQFFGVDYDNRD